tara:strand:+ start:891 stop:1313 length:423 start_codon:yes stop_codon:yes gene_type:complete
VPLLNGNEISSTDQLLEFHNTFSSVARDLMKRKNADYTDSCKGGNPFLNFTRCESMGVCSVEQGFLVRLTDKMSRLSTFCNGNKFEVVDESVMDTILDASNYLILLAGYITSQAATTENHNKGVSEWPPSQSLPIETLDK